MAAKSKVNTEGQRQAPVWVIKNYILPKGSGFTKQEGEKTKRYFFGNSQLLIVVIAERLNLNHL